MVAAALVLLALVAGMAGTTLGLVEARRQDRIAVAESQEKEKARQAEALQRRHADEQRRQAEKRLTQIEKANEILGSIFKDLNPGTPEQEGKPTKALLGERLDQAAAQIEGEAIGDPLTVARMQMTLGRSLRGLGYSEKAIALFAKARETFAARLGPDHHDTLASMHNLIWGYWEAGKSDRPRRSSRLTGEGEARPRPPRHTPPNERSRSCCCWLDSAPLPRSPGAEKGRLGPDHRDTLVSMRPRCGLQDRRSARPALPLFQEAHAEEGQALPITPPQFQHQPPRSRLPGRRSSSTGRRSCVNWPLWKCRAAGFDPLRRVPARSELASTKWTEAETVLRELLTIRETKAPDNWLTFNTKSQLGGALLGQRIRRRRALAPGRV